MADEELRLVAESQQGDVDAFNQLVRLYESRLFNLCYRMLGDRDSAADATQDAFISAYRNLNRFRGGSFRAWLFRIATNLCYDALRARKRKPATSLDAALAAEDDTAYFDPPDPGETLDESALRQELGTAIQQALQALSAEQRVVLVLCDIQGFAYDEIARITGSNLGTVKSRLSRGRARLRELLKAGELLPARYRHGDED